MFKRKLLTALVATAAVGISGFAMNVSADTATGTANATILTPLSITAGVAMDFGSIAPPLAGGAVVLDTANTIPATAGFAFTGL